MDSKESYNQRLKITHPLSWALRLLILFPSLVVGIILIAEELESMVWWEVMLVLLVVSLPLIFAFYSAATVTLNVGQVKVGFRPVYWKTIPLSSLKSVSLVNEDPMKFGGWGVKGSLKKNGLMLSAGGERALLFETIDDQKVFVSVGDNVGKAEEIVDAVRNAI